jgi:ATP-dependent RNA helicase SUPV3L1/SUV3
MGLNLDVDHVAFAGVRKFDGQVHRHLTPSELAQIAGRAGRHMNDGTFGVTGTVPAFTTDVIERLETHAFDGAKALQWRSRDLDFTSLDRLRDSLRRTPDEPRLARARMADDTIALENVSADPELAALATNPEAVARLWDVCQVPDYRKISSQDHSELVGTLYKFLMGSTGRIPVDWFANQVAFADRTDGDIDTLATRIAHIRTWTFVSNRANWLDDPEHWQGRTRAIEDALSDALHECLTQRFIDRRTSALMRGLKEKDELVAEIGQDGAVHVEKQYVGRLQGFRFFPDAQAEGIHGKATRTAAAQVLARELAMRARRVAAAKNDAFKLSPRGLILWRDEEVGRLEPGDDLLKPVVVIAADEAMGAADKEKVQERLTTWVADTVAERLKPLLEMANAKDLTGLARGIAFRLSEGLGVLRREAVAEEVRALDQPARAQLRGYGVRFGAFNIYFPALLKPAAVELSLALWLLKQGTQGGLDPANPPALPRPGLTSVVVDANLPEAYYHVAGFHPCGTRAVRIDILERLADQIRPLVAWRPDPASSNPPPKGATGDGGFRVMPDMMSILGCSLSDVGEILQKLGFRLERIPAARREENPSEAKQPEGEDVPAPEAAAAPAATPTEPASGEAAEAIQTEPEVDGAASDRAAEAQSVKRNQPSRRARSQWQSRSSTRYGAHAGRAGRRSEAGAGWPSSRRSRPRTTRSTHAGGRTGATSVTIGTSVAKARAGGAGKPGRSASAPSAIRRHRRPRPASIRIRRSRR